MTVIRQCYSCINLLNAKFAVIFAVILICKANQLTGFYMTATLAFNELRVTKNRTNLKAKTDISSKTIVRFFFLNFQNLVTNISTFSHSNDLLAPVLTHFLYS